MDQFRPREDQSPMRDLQRGLEDLKAMFDRFYRGRGTWLIIAVVFAVYLAFGIYIVGQGEKGVELLFGKVNAVTEPGLRYCLPRPFMSRYVVDVSRLQRAEIGFRTDMGRTRQVPTESLMLTGDENIVDVQLFVQYVVRDPVEFLFGAEDPDKALRASAEVALRGIVGENTIDNTMTTERALVQQKVQAYLQKLLNDYRTGLQVKKAELLVVDAPAQVQEAFHDVVRALEDRERLVKEAEGFQEDVVPKARGMAQQEIRQAEAFKAQRVIRATGDAQRFERILEEYMKAPEVTRERIYLEGVEKFLLPAKKYILEGKESGVLPLLPLFDRPQGTQPVRSEKDESAPAPLPKKGN